MTVQGKPVAASNSGTCGETNALLELRDKLCATKQWPSKQDWPTAARCTHTIDPCAYDKREACSGRRMKLRCSVAVGATTIERMGDSCNHMPPEANTAIMKELCTSKTPLTLTDFQKVSCRRP